MGLVHLRNRTYKQTEQSALRRRLWPEAERPLSSGRHEERDTWFAYCCLPLSPRSGHTLRRRRCYDTLFEEAASLRYVTRTDGCSHRLTIENHSRPAPAKILGNGVSFERHSGSG